MSKDKLKELKSIQDISIDKFIGKHFNLDVKHTGEILCRIDQLQLSSISSNILIFNHETLDYIKIRVEDILGMKEVEASEIHINYLEVKHQEKIKYGIRD